MKNPANEPANFELSPIHVIFEGVLILACTCASRFQLQLWTAVEFSWISLITSQE